MNIEIDNTGLWSLEELKPGTCFQYVENTGEIYMCVDYVDPEKKNKKSYVNLKTGRVDYHTWCKGSNSIRVNRINTTCIVTNSRMARDISKSEYTRKACTYHVQPVVEMSVDQNIYDDEFYEDYLDDELYKEGLKDD